MTPDLAANTTTISYRTGVVFTLCAGLCWSFIPVGIRGFEDANVWQILFFRSIGVLPLVIWLIHRQSHGQIRHSMKSVGLAGYAGALGLVIAYAGGIAAVRMTSIANAAFLFATAPFLAAILARVVLGEALRKHTLLALVLAMLGILVMVYESISLGNWLGNLLALASAVGFAVFATSLRVSSLRESSPQATSGDAANSLPIVLIGACLAIIVAFSMSLITRGSLFIPGAEIALALGIGILLLGNGMVLCTFGSTVVPAAELALLCMTEVIFAPIWAWFLLNERPIDSVLIGGAIVIAAIVLNAVTGIRNKPVPLGH